MGSILTTKIPIIGEIWVYDSKKYYIILDKDKHGAYDLLCLNEENEWVERIHKGYDMIHWLHTDVWEKLV
jgi:hypothetical protein